jgi:predicted O-methyltransferase YrrM
MRRGTRHPAVGAVRAWLGRTVVRPFEARLARVVRAEVERAVRDVEFRARRDLLAAGERDAALSSARFAHRMMPTAREFHEPIATLQYALDLAPSGGMALEFGVFRGRSLSVIAETRKGRGVFGFDSFQGLPEDYRPHVRQGAFALDRAPEVEGAELVVGWFEDTLPDFLGTHPGPVDFLHVDGDLYSSTVTVLSLVGPRLHAGSVVVFDEFFNWPGWEDDGEFRAWQEYLERTGTQAEYVAYSSNDEQVVVRIVEPELGPQE